MAWTYGGDPSKNNLDAVRYLVRDADEADPIVQDEEINFALSQNGNNLYRAAADVCDAIALELGRQLDFNGPQAWDSNKKYEQYKQMATDFRARAAKRGVSIFAGGISVADKQSRSDDTDRVANDFTKTLHDAPGTAPETVVPNTGIFWW